VKLPVSSTFKCICQWLWKGCAKRYTRKILYKTIHSDKRKYHNIPIDGLTAEHSKYVREFASTNFFTSSSTTFLLSMRSDLLPTNIPG